MTSPAYRRLTWPRPLGGGAAPRGAGSQLGVAFALLAWLGLGAGALAAPAKKPKPSPVESKPPPSDPLESESAPQQPTEQPQPSPSSETPSSQPGHASPSHSASSASNTAQPPPPPPPEKAGPFMANFKVGPALCLYACEHRGAFILEIGIAVVPGRRGYLMLPLQFQAGPAGGEIIVPLGFQYDLAVPRVPGLYLTPRFSIGYAALITNNTGLFSVVHGGVAIPEFGLKYVIRGRWNLGAELFSLPIFFGKNSGGPFASVYYRILLSFGANF